jgi:hypothetical protein
MAKKTKRRKSAPRRGSSDSVLWVRLPADVSPETLKKLRPEQVALVDRDASVAAVTPRGEVAAMLQESPSPALKRLLADAGLAPKAECFGGDTCIV